MRSFVFNCAYWFLSGVYAILCAILALVPGRRVLMHGLRSYCRATVILMRVVCGIRVDVRGTPPKDQPVIIGAKHQSWGDGIVMMAKCGDVNFVCGDHMLKFPLIGWVLKRCGAIVLSNGGGAEAEVFSAAEKAVAGWAKSQNVAFSGVSVLNETLPTGARFETPALLRRCQASGREERPAAPPAG